MTSEDGRGQQGALLRACRADSPELDSGEIGSLRDDVLEICNGVDDICCWRGNDVLSHRRRVEEPCKGPQLIPQGAELAGHGVYWHHNGKQSPLRIHIPSLVLKYWFARLRRWGKQIRVPAQAESDAQHMQHRPALARICHDRVQ